MGNDRPTSPASSLGSRRKLPLGAKAARGGYRSRGRAESGLSLVYYISLVSLSLSLLRRVDRLARKKFTSPHPPKRQLQAPSMSFLVHLHSSPASSVDQLGLHCLISSQRNSLCCSREIDALFRSLILHFGEPFLDDLSSRDERSLDPLCVHRYLGAGAGGYGGHDCSGTEGRLFQLAKCGLMSCRPSSTAARLPSASAKGEAM